MNAIVCEYLPQTNTKPRRIRAQWGLHRLILNVDALPKNEDCKVKFRHVAELLIQENVFCGKYKLSDAGWLSQKFIFSVCLESSFFPNNR